MPQPEFKKAVEELQTLPQVGMPPEAFVTQMPVIERKIDAVFGAANPNKPIIVGELVAGLTGAHLAAQQHKPKEEIQETFAAKIDGVVKKYAPAL